MSRKIVFRDYSQEELDRQYDQRTLVPDISDFVADAAEGTERARATFECSLDVAYGSKADERLDIYGAGGENRPILIFFHGGAWRLMSKNDAAAAANVFVPKGALYVAVGFGLAPETRLEDMVRQCRSAVASMRKDGREFGGDVDRIFLAGHSSGAHLAAMTAAADWEADFDCPADTVKGVVLVSGPYDLEPVRLSSRNEYLRLDEVAARRNSPIHFCDRLPMRPLIAWGGGELDEFQRQARDFVERAEAAGRAPGRLFFEGTDHFAMAQALYRQGHPLCEATLEMMNLA